MGVRCLDGIGPSLKNVALLDQLAVPMISCMAATGLQVDLDHFARMDVELTRDLERVTEEVHQLTGYYVNLGSGDQVADLLFKKLGLKQARQKLTKSGDRESVEDEVLTAIQHEHPVVPLCQNYKEFEKLLGTYVKPMPKLTRRTKFGTYRIYPQLGQSRVPSGRLNCKNPNLLAMPTRTDRGREIRMGFITDPGWCYVSVDESQIEVRIAAHRSQDPALMNVYFNEEDVYSDFATSAFKLKDERYKSESGKWKYPTVNDRGHRRPAKVCVLASIYDVTAKGLLEQMPVVCKNCNKPTTCLDCEQGVEHTLHTKHDCINFVGLWNENNCQDLINVFYNKYSKLLVMRKQDHSTTRQFSYLWDDWGRILHVAAVKSVHEYVVSSALREAANFPIQAMAQGTVKLTMAAVQDDLESTGLLDVAHPLLQIHDELLFECKEDVAQDLIELVRYRFENCVRLDVPIKASGATAYNWGSIAK